MQTQTSNTLHNAIMEAGGKDRPPMLAPDKEVPISKGSPVTTTQMYMETYKNVSQDIRDQLNAEAEAVQIILTGIDNDIYSTVDACLNACEMWKATERSQQAATRNRGKAIVNSPQPIYDQEHSMVAKDDEKSKDKEIDKLMALISLSFKKIYKPTNNNLRTSSNTSRANQDNSPRINRSTGYENQRIGNVAGARETVEQADWRDDTDDESKNQELEAHYMYMAQIQEVSPDAANFGPIFDTEPLQKVSTDDQYNAFAIESEHPEQSEFVHDTYPIEQDEHNVIIDSLDMTPEAGEVIRLEKESQSKLSDLIRPFDYDKLNNLYDLFVPQRKNSSEQRYFSERSRLSHTHVNNGNSKESFNKQTTSLEKRMDESILWDQKFQSSKELFKIKRSVGTIFDGVERCKETIEEMVADLRYFNSLELEVYSLKSQLETRKTQFLNEIDRLSREYYSADHMNAILGVYTELDEDLKAQLQDKCIVISELKKLIEKMKGKYVDTKFEKSSVIRQPNAFKSQRPSILGKPTIFSDSLERKDFSKSNLNAKTLNVNFIYATCGKCMLNEKHDMYVLKSVNGVISKTQMPIAVPVNTREPKCTVKHSVANPLKKIKFLGTVKFRNDQIAPILGYGDLVQGVVMIKRVYYVEGLKHNLFFVGQFCDADLEVAFRKSIFSIRDLKGNDLITGSRGIDLYSITLQDTNSPNPICLMAKATSSQAWLWHCRLSHLNFDTNNLLLKNDIVVGLSKLKFVKDHLCSSYELGKAKRKSFHTKTTPSSKRRLQLLHMDLCSPMSKDETPEVLIDFLMLVQRGLYAQMASDHVSSDPVPECPTTALEHVSLSPGLQCQENVSHAAETVITSNELDFLFSLMFDELLNGSSQVVSKSSAATTADTPNQRQQHNITPLNNQTTPDPTCQVLTHAPTVASTENMNQAEMVEEYSQVENDEFINIFYHPLEQVIGNPSQSVRTRRQLESDAEMCMFALTEELHQFDRLDAAIAISCNLVQHSRTKHIDVRYHFIKEKVEKGIVELFFVGTEYQLAGLFTKALPEERFKYLIRRHGMRCLTPEELKVLANESA
nr:retrovirus-related Pol polyprotein from transposon TNT 1-94 [Tanacetum cinerariifolium]